MTTNGLTKHVIFGDEVLDMATDIHPLSTVREERSLFDCDTPGWHHDESESSLADLYWSLLLYRDESERLEATCNRDHAGRMVGGLTVTIHTGAPGEPASTLFTIEQG